MTHCRLARELTPKSGTKVRGKSVVVQRKSLNPELQISILGEIQVPDLRPTLRIGQRNQNPRGQSPQGGNNAETEAKLENEGWEPEGDEELIAAEPAPEETILAFDDDLGKGFCRRRKF